MLETEVSGSKIFAESPVNPYGFPVIKFPSDDGDSTFYMVEGHHPPIRKLIATFNWVVRHNGIYFLTNRRPDSFLEWGYARYFSNDENQSIRIELGATGKPVTFFEV